MVPLQAALRWTLAAVLACGSLAHAAEIGQVKIAKGTVMLVRDGQPRAANAGMRVQGSDVVQTGVDGSVGITMSDNSQLSLGPNSVLSLDRYEFDPATHRGAFDASLRHGSMAVVSGSIAKQSPDAMTVRTPFAVLGVRGTAFAVSANEPWPATR